MSELPGLLARTSEVRRLRKTVRLTPRPPPAQLVDLTPTQAVWRIPIPGQADRFLKAESGMIDDQYFVVHVDADAFYLAWLRASQSISNSKRHDACVLRSEMPNDRKFHHAESCFSPAAVSAVSLAQPVAERCGDQVDIGFQDGITRTFWLLANRASAFPMFVDGHTSAALLNDVAGLESAPLSFVDLFGKAQ